jgi:hypothetical protein
MQGAVRLHLAASGTRIPTHDRELERGSSAPAEYFRRELYLDSLRSQVKLAVRIATQE